MRLIDADALIEKKWQAENEGCFYALEDVVSVTDIEEAPTIELCEDAISRKAALITLKNAYPSMPFTKRAKETWEREYKDYIEATEILSKLPSVAPSKPLGEWVKKPHKVYLPRDYEPDINDYRDHQYNEEDHSIVQYWWHCNQCDYEADKWFKPIFNFCPHCGAQVKGTDNEL